MKPIVNPLWFYLINICGKAGGVLLAPAIIFGIIAVICIGIYICVLDDGEYKYYSDESKKMVDSTFKFGKKIRSNLCCFLYSFVFDAIRESLLSDDCSNYCNTR